MRRHAKALLVVLVAMLTLGASVAVAVQTHEHEAAKDLNGSTTPGESFCCLSGVAVDQSGGDLYALDTFAPPEFSFGTAHRYGSDGSYEASFSGPETWSNPQDLAVDSSGGASDGTLYVTDTGNGLIYALDEAGNPESSFDADGVLDGAATPAGSFSGPCGLAVDQTNGNLYVSDQGNNRIWIFDAEGKYLDRVIESSLNGPCGIALDSTGDLYVRNANDGKVLKLERTGPTDYEFAGVRYAPTDNETPEDPGDDLPFATDVAVDTSTDHLYVNRGDRIVELDSEGNPVSSFGGGVLSGSSAGVAVDSTFGTVYVADGGVVRRFGPLATLADTTTKPPTDVTPEGATLNGSLDPAGGPNTTECYFEWGTDTSYGNEAPCAEGDVFSAAEEVSAELVGLNPGTEYHYRLVVESPEGTNQGQDVAFATVGLPVIVLILGDTSLFASTVNATTAKLNVQINPAGAPTTYRFEYVERAEFEANGFDNAAKAPAPDASLGTGSVEIPASRLIEGLSPETTYRYRVVATNSAGTTTSIVKAFTTLAVPAAAVEGQLPGRGFLPDGRAWEMVTPLDKNGGTMRSQGQITMVSSDGNRIGYAAPANFSDTKGTGFVGQTQYVATRRAGGWTSDAVTPRPSESISQLLAGLTIVRYSPDLKHAVVSAFDLPYVEGDIQGGAFNLYRQTFADEQIEPITMPMAGAISPGLQGSLIGGSSDFSRVFFRFPGNLLPELNGSGPAVYEWDQGSLRLAGVLPDGSEPPGGSGPAAGAFSYNRKTVSFDGSRALFIAPAQKSGPPQQLYMREDGTTTTLISESEGSTPVPEPAEVRYEATSPDLQTVMFTTASQLNDEDPGGVGYALYAYTHSEDPTADTNLEFITRREAQGISVPGISADGSRGFFFLEGQESLYHWDSKGERLVIPYTGAKLRQAEAHTVTATFRVSRDGRRMAFLSDQELGGADLGSEGVVPYKALYVYDATSDKLVCVSCPRSGAITHGDTYVWPESSDDPFGLAFFPTNFFSEDGRWTFFSTPDALVSEDTNGIVDAYEYDLDEGRPYLLSSGRSTKESWFADASSDGTNTFFITAEPLSGWDVDAAKDMYVARVDGGLPEPVPPPPGCEGDACQPPPVALNDPTPSSAGFSGTGNSKVVSKGRHKCGVHKVRRRGRCVTRKQAIKKTRKSQQAKRRNHNRRAGK